jgi:hypothetical protein
VVQSAGYAFVSVAVECVKTQTAPSVNVRVNLTCVVNRVAVDVHDTGLFLVVGVEEKVSLIGFIIWSFDVTVTKRGFDCGKLRY